MRPVYIITFCCYGSILPGQNGVVDDDSNLYMDQKALSISEVCLIRRWNLLATHVRANHVHTVLEADAISERVLLNFKVMGKRKRWARHGSTCYIWTKPEIDRAVSYVVSNQGPPMSLYEAPRRVPE
jgi:hypothetical protein